MNQEHHGRLAFERTMLELEASDAVTLCSCTSCALARLNRRLIAENKALHAEIARLKKK